MTLFIYFIFYLDMRTSPDLITWSPPKRIFTSNAGYSSPGNVLFDNNRWIMCFQTYPISRFKEYGNDNCRLWLSESKDLEHWSPPHIISSKGSQAQWASNPRQIDPFLFPFHGNYYCFYKAHGALGLLKSSDLQTWEEFHSESPVFSKKDTPDNTTIENVCIVEHKNEFYMFFSPCYIKRGIGVARSKNLLDWTFVQYLKFPKFLWAESGPTAPSILKMNQNSPQWLMAFHADRARPHHAVLGLAWSDDLFNWNTN